MIPHESPKPTLISFTLITRMNAFGFFLLHSILLSLVGLSTSGNTFLGNETDRLALLAFKDGISHDPFQVMSSWNDSLYFCEWQGVTCCTRHQRVLKLNLMSQGLVGSISPSIGNLSFLRIINLENNNFQGEIPQEVGRLFRLQKFKMTNNSFTGEIPINMSHLSNLESLLLGQNNLVGNIPIEIGSLSKLVQLALYKNNLTGVIPHSLGNLSFLNILSIGGNTLEGRIPDSLGQLKNLKAIDLGPNDLSGIIPPSLYNISSLEFFSVPENNLNGSLPHEIGLNLPNLRSFFFGMNHFFGSIPVSLFNASRLEKLALDDNNFIGKVPIEVGSLKGLQRLNLAVNNFGNGNVDDLNFLNSLTNSTNLQILIIFDNHFGGKLPNSISNLSIQLNLLHLGKNQIFGSIPYVIVNLINLILLSIEDNFLTDSIPKGIGMLQKVQILNLSGNRLSGSIPSSLGNISQLYSLNLSYNFLEGNIISDIGKYQHLQTLDLSRNNLNGTLPKQIINFFPQLNIIDLASNSLTGSLPLELGNLKNLENLDVSGNKMYGTIPHTLGSCLSLENLLLQNNLFEGPIPPSLTSLKGIQYLDLSCNNFSGKIPKDLEDLSFLEYLNMSFNDLEGEVPVRGVFQNVSAFSIVGNSKLCGGVHELQLHTCYSMKSKKQGILSLTFKVTIGIFLSLSIVVASFLAIYWTRKTQMKSSSTLFLSGDWYERLSYNELHKATDGFSSRNLIGMGNFGSVYKGVLYQDEMPIAVKVFNLVVRGAFKSFVAECSALRELRHRNLIKIWTACSSVDFKGNDFKALVFEFMPNGSLENWLHPDFDEQRMSRNLNTCDRLNIAINVASALDYLHNHFGTPIVHCDLKPNNVLLDNDMVAHVGDFGLAKFLTKGTTNSKIKDTSTLAIKGTVGYIPPEYGMGVAVSTQGDVYSYGILLLEMFTGKKPTDDLFKDGLSLHNFSKMALTSRVMEIVDPHLLLEEDHDETINDTEQKLHDCLISIIRIGVECSLETQCERMNIKDVLMELYIIKEVFLGVGIHGERQTTLE